MILEIIYSWIAIGILSSLIAMWLMCEKPPSNIVIVSFIILGIVAGPILLLNIIYYLIKSTILICLGKGYIVDEKYKNFNDFIGKL